MIRAEPRAHARNGVDCGILRAISDNADGEAPGNFLEFLMPAVETTVRVVEYFLEQEGAL